MLISILLTTANLIVRVKIVSNLVKYKNIDYFKKVIIPIVKVSIVSVLIPLTLTYVMDMGFGRLLSTTIISLFSIIITVYLIGLTKEEKLFINNKLKAIKLK